MEFFNSIFKCSVSVRVAGQVGGGVAQFDFSVKLRSSSQLCQILSICKFVKVK